MADSDWESIDRGWRRLAYAHIVAGIAWFGVGVFNLIVHPEWGWFTPGFAFGVLYIVGGVVLRRSMD